MKAVLNDAGREELALALLLWKDFKTQDSPNQEITLQMFALAQILGVQKQLEALMSKVPPMRIVPK